MAAQSSRTITFDNLNATTNAFDAAVVSDAYFNDDLLLKELMGKKKTADGGEWIYEELEYAGATTGYYDGYDILEPQEVEIITKAKYEWANVYADISISETDFNKNNGQPAIIDLVKVKISNMSKALDKKVTTGIFSADTTNIVGLRVANNTTNTTGTYGGISRTNEWWQNQVKDVVALANLSLPMMNASFMSCLDGTKKKPTVGVTTQLIWNQVWELMEAKGRRPEDGRPAYAGFNAINFNSTPLIVDSQCPAGYLYWLNSQYIFIRSMSSNNRKIGPWEKPTNQEVKSKRMKSTLQLVCNNLRHIGVMHNAA